MTRWIRPLLRSLVFVATLFGIATPSLGVDLSVDVSASRKPINPLIYGLHYATNQAFAQEIDLPVRRWGGNDASMYNWTINAFNNGLDYYFENNSRGAESADAYIERDQQTQSRTILTIPMLGYVAKDTTSCGFSVANYGYTAQSTDGFRPDCGNGVRVGDGSVVVGNDPLDVGAPADANFAADWALHLIQAFGTAQQGGVAFYGLDNEPGLWHETHRDVHPAPLSYTEIFDKGIAYAAAIKSVDPGAQTLGPVQDGWTRYFFASYVDYDQASTDRNDNGGGMDFIPWYLQQMKAYQDQHAVRLLDYLDVHYYPQSSGVTLVGAGGAATKALRLRSVKSLYDANYVDESWIAGAGPDNGIIRLIPRMREWIDTYYPGTKFAITEYNWGGLDDINGALAQADVLGIFGREGVDLATMFDTSYSGGAFTPTGPGAFAFRIYRNYDGNGARFGDTGVAATSSDPDQLSIYAAQRSSDGVLTIVVLNKTASASQSAVSVTGFPAASSARVFRYSDADLGNIVQPADVAVAAGAITAGFPANSITLLTVPEPGSALAGLIAGLVVGGLARLRKRETPRPRGLVAALEDPRDLSPSTQVIVL
jgi:hypothetical protein